MNWFMTAVKKYATFSGRSQRSEYWYFLLFYMIIYIVLAVVDGITGSFSAKSGVGLLTGIFSLAMLLPSLAVTVRRLHDTDRSGWWILIGLIPLIGRIVLLLFLVHDSGTGANRFGENPKAATSHFQNVRRISIACPAEATC
jgi:uncharacterized membrane protein YhaH (DUF805 family)